MKVLVILRGQRYFLLCVALVLFFHNVSTVSAQDVSVVGTSQQTNERIKTLGTSLKPSVHEYIIGNGDLVSIAVFDVPELTRDIRVSQNGTIGMPLIPTRLHIAGLTETQAEQMIADVLQANGLVSHPDVGVTVKEHKSRPITIVGAVQHPMVYEAESTVTLLEALAEAGGINPDAGDTILVTRSRSSSFLMIPNPDPIASPAPGAASSAPEVAASEPPALDKDASSNSTSSNFPSASEMAKNSPAPAESGTSTQPATPPVNIITINLNDLLESGDTRNNIALQAGDVVTVPHAGIVYVLGAVNRPGGFVLSNDRSQLTTLKVLSLAGGLTRIAKLDHAYIIRKDAHGKQTQTELDLKKIMDRKAEDLQMRASDVLYVPDSRAKEVLYQALQAATTVALAAAIYRVAY